MTPQEILTRITSIAALSPGFLRQDPYRSELFRLCEDAYAAGFHEPTATPRLTGEAMERYLLDFMAPDTLERFEATWDAWLYAFKRLKH